MAAGEYVSMRSQREAYEHLLLQKRAAIETSPEREEEGLVLIFEAKGLPRSRRPACGRACDVRSRGCPGHHCQGVPGNQPGPAWLALGRDNKLVYGICPRVTGPDSALHTRRWGQGCAHQRRAERRGSCVCRRHPVVDVIPESRLGRAANALRGRAGGVRHVCCGQPHRRDAVRVTHPPLDSRWWAGMTLHHFPAQPFLRRQESISSVSLPRFSSSAAGLRTAR